MGMCLILFSCREDVNRARDRCRRARDGNFAQTSPAGTAGIRAEMISWRARLMP